MKNKIIFLTCGIAIIMTTFYLKATYNSNQIPKNTSTKSEIKENINTTNTNSTGFSNKRDTPPPPTKLVNSWLSLPLNDLSNDLYNFIEKENIIYIHISELPLYDKESQLYNFVKDGFIILFDNTEKNNIKNEENIHKTISKFFGTSSKGDVILAVAIKKKMEDFII
ncbi:hypothetical protein [Aliivibrio fischeri]|uniref:hypothetical protein n=1 Tax=Aliivibrio fischeri TaxID=668 RepID=UPI0006D2561E|nr:hypothetical protein [Aliivibrio fischeri]USR98014.1 hypothetical protein AVFI_16250 [Aliivibrio fischeri ATCC 7744 = JCM 18803 = DSM 507]GGK41202.1 hypothetical protein GCM10007987_25610 [Aliivibrio fischeri]